MPSTMTTDTAAADPFDLTPVQAVLLLGDLHDADIRPSPEQADVLQGVADFSPLETELLTRRCGVLSQALRPLQAGSQGSAAALAAALGARLDREARPSAQTPDPGLFDLTAVQAVRVLGELTQGLELTPEQHAVLRRTRTSEQVNDLQDRCSDLWDEIKDHSGPQAPAGTFTPVQMADFLKRVMQEELDLSTQQEYLQRVKAT